MPPRLPTHAAKGDLLTDPGRGVLDPPTGREAWLAGSVAAVAFAGWALTEWIAPDTGMRFIAAMSLLGAISVGVLWSLAALVRRRLGASPPASSLALLLMVYVGGFGPPLLAIGTFALDKLAVADDFFAGKSFLAALFMVMGPAADLAWRHWHVGSLRKHFAAREASEGAASKLAQLEYMAFHDSLTGLANRPNFERQLAEALRSGTCGAVLLIDLDKFKRINDVHGHAAGDEFLVHVARRLRGAIREVDLPARLGGDEFAVLLRGGVDDAVSARLAERIVLVMAEPFMLDGAVVHSGASIGIAAGPPGGCEPDVITASADAAMYEAKRAGGSRYVLAPRAGSKCLARLA